MNFLFLRGLARNREHWYDFEKAFQNELNQVLAIDFPGNGEFANLNSPLTIDEILTFTRNKFLTLKNNSGPFTLVGISMGGMVALLWLKKYPEDFSKVVIINSSARKMVYPWQRFSLNTFMKLPFLLFSSSINQEMSILKLTTNQLNKSELEKILKRSQENVLPKTSKINFLRQLFCAARFLLPKIDDALSLKKLIIIASKKDHLVSYKASVNIAKYYYLPIIIHENAGHDLPLDDKAWLKKIICDQSCDD